MKIQKDALAYDLQEIQEIKKYKERAIFLCFEIFYSLIVAADIVISLSSSL